MSTRLLAAFVLLGYDYMMGFNMPFIIAVGAVFSVLVTKGIRYGKSVGHNYGG